MQTNKREINKISMIQLLEEGYSYIWLQETDCVELKPIGEVELHMEKLIEARIFSKDKELHLFLQDDVWCAVETIKEEADDFFEEVQMLRSKFGRTITFRHFINYDEDGQAYIERSVIAGYETNQ